MAPFVLLFVLIIFIFSIVGMQAFGLYASDEFMRFDSFYASFVLCFQCVLGEGINNTLYQTMNDVGMVASLFFVAITVVGTLILLNLVLAVILKHASPAIIQFDIGFLLLDQTFNKHEVRMALHKMKFSLEEHRRLNYRHRALVLWNQLEACYGEDTIMELCQIVPHGVMQALSSEFGIPVDFEFEVQDSIRDEFCSQNVETDNNVQSGGDLKISLFKKGIKNRLPFATILQRSSLPVRN